MKRILTWVKSTWNWMHIWNYFWAVKPIIDISVWNNTFLMLADLHSLTSVHEAKILKENKKRILTEYFSILWDIENIVVFEQSYLLRHTDLMRIINSVTPYSLMLRAHAFKDSQSKNSDINMATFNYPILMTSDIINFDADLVPVWKDQKQHIEFARDIAENFNKLYNWEYFKLPEAVISEELWIIPWTDWRKMSKSYNNFIWIFDDEKTMKQKIMSIVTDDTPLESPKNPDTCNVFALIKLFANEKQILEIRQKYLAWGYWYGHAKLELLSLILNYFSKVRENYKNYTQNYNLIEEKLEKWNKIAREIVLNKYEKISKVVWL